jgi:hypothetical protein
VYLKRNHPEKPDGAYVMDVATGEETLVARERSCTYAVFGRATNEICLFRRGQRLAASRGWAAAQSGSGGNLRAGLRRPARRIQRPRAAPVYGSDLAGAASAE